MAWDLAEGNVGPKWPNCLHRPKADTDNWKSVKSARVCSWDKRDLSLMTFLDPGLSWSSCVPCSLYRHISMNCSSITELSNPRGDLKKPRTMCLSCCIALLFSVRQGWLIYWPHIMEEGKVDTKSIAGWGLASCLCQVLRELILLLLIKIVFWRGDGCGMAF